MNIAVVASMLDVFGFKKSGAVFENIVIVIFKKIFFNYLKKNQTNIFFYFLKFIFNINTLKQILKNKFKTKK
jgi:hypothetical protein